MGCSLLRREQFLAARELALASYHEVRNPLSGGTHHLRQLQEDLMTFGRGNERSSDTLAARRVQASVDAALQCMDQACTVLDTFSNLIKLEHGAFQPAQRPINLASILHSALLVARPSMNPGVELRARLASVEALTRHVLADEVSPKRCPAHAFHASRPSTLTARQLSVKDRG